MSAIEEANNANFEDISDDETPDLETDASGRKLSKTERKARKALVKAGLTTVPNVTRVTLKRAKNVVFAINEPEVFRAPGTNTYVVFGEAKTEDFASALRQQAGSFANVPAAASADAEEEEDAAPADETGLEADEIETVMSQGNCSRNKAIKALREKGNVVDAILEVSA